MASKRHDAEIVPFPRPAHKDDPIARWEETIGEVERRLIDTSETLETYLAQADAVRLRDHIKPRRVQQAHWIVAILLVVSASAMLVVAKGTNVLGVLLHDPSLGARVLPWALAGLLLSFPLGQCIRLVAALRRAPSYPDTQPRNHDDQLRHYDPTIPQANRPPNVLEFDDRLKISIAIMANIFLIVAVDAIRGLEDIFGRGQIPTVALLIFNCLALAQIIYYGAVAASDKINDLLTLLFRETHADTSEGGNSTARAKNNRKIVRYLGNIQIPATLNFLLVGYLIYVSGGIANSPYSSVPIAMMIIGQSVYYVPPIEFGPRRKMPRLLTFFWEVVSPYAYPLLLMAFLLGSLIALQNYIPLVTKAAPAIETIFTTFLILLVSMCATFIRRRANQVVAR